MLELGEVSVSFEADTRLSDQSGNITQNFFDSSNLKICTVRNNGALGLIVKSLKSDDVISVRTKDRGCPRLVKLSPNSKLAIFQRQNNSVDVILLEKNDGSCCSEFSIGTKSKESIISVDWVSDSQILFMTKQCLELFQLNEEKRTAKLQKTSTISASWSIYYAKSNLLIFTSGVKSSIIQPIIIHHGQFTKLKSFDVDYGASNSKNLLHDKDVIVTSIYGKIYVMVIRYSHRNSTTTDIALYELSTDPSIASKIKYSLNLGFAGGFGIHIIDNLVVVHHQTTAKSMIFDIGIAQSRPSHSSLITVSVVPSSLCLSPPPLYTPLWSMFQPDIIIDPIAGMMYQLKIKCDLAKNEIEDKCTLIEFLMNRSDQKTLVLSALAECLKTKSLTLRQIRKLFNILTEKYSLSLSQGIKAGEVSKWPLISCNFQYLRIEQKELQSRLFIPLMEDPVVDKKYVANTMLQFLRSLHRSSIPVEAYFLELLVGSLASAGEMAKLHQLVTYRVISDSKPLAFLLLSYEARCPSLFQSGVDILARQKAFDEIVEVLLERGHVVDAVRYLEAHSPPDINNLKVMEVAARKDRVVQHAVFSYFQTKKGKDDLALFSKQFKSLYDQDEVMEAEKEVATAVQFV